MTNTSDGLSWSVSTPVSASPRKDGAAEILGLRVGAGLRYDKEHVAAATMSAGPDLSTGGGEHKAGSAMAYFQDADPTQRPDAATTLTAADSGRLFVDTSGSTFVMKVYDHDTTSFVTTSGVQQASGTETTAAIVAAPVTVTVGFIPDLFYFTFGTSGSRFHAQVISIASDDPMRVAFYTHTSEALIEFSMNGTDVDITFVSQTNSMFSNQVDTFWRAVKF